MPPGTTFPMNKKHAHAAWPRGVLGVLRGGAHGGKSRRFSRKFCHRLTRTGGRGLGRKRARAKERGRTKERAEEEESTDRKRAKAEDDDGGGGDGGKF